MCSAFSEVAPWSECLRFLRVALSDKIQVGAKNFVPQKILSAEIFSFKVCECKFIYLSCYHRRPYQSVHMIWTVESSETLVLHTSWTFCKADNFSRRTQIWLSPLKSSSTTASLPVCVAQRSVWGKHPLGIRSYNNNIQTRLSPTLLHTHRHAYMPKIGGKKAWCYWRWEEGKRRFGKILFKVHRINLKYDNLEWVWGELFSILLHWT